jgi:flagellar biogenesis protein FliO
MNKGSFKKVIFLACLIFMIQAFAEKAKVLDINFDDKGREGKVTIKLDREIKGFPELSVKDNFVQVSVPGSFVWPKIEKKFSLKKSFDSKLMAYQFDKSRVRVRAILPKGLEGKAEQVSLQLKGNSIVVSFPKSKVAIRNVGRSPAVIGKPVIAKKANDYDESYLDKLLKEKEQKLEAPKAKKVESRGSFLASNEKGQKVQKDQVNLALSGNEKKQSNFSLTTYAGKFVGFLALVLLLFYAIVTFFKKGAFSKGKLGFLNSTKMVEVLNTTYIGPKRSLMLIKAHKQVFLVGSSEKGLHMISEINDMNGIFKEGEKQISGSNFDSNLDVATKEEPTFKLKDFLGAEEEKTEEFGATDNAALRAIEREMVAAKDSTKVKFSDQIKNKVKGLKSLQ